MKINNPVRYGTIQIKLSVLLLILLINIGCVTVKTSKNVTPSQVETAFQNTFKDRGFTVKVNIQRFTGDQYDILITYIDYDTSYTPTLGTNTVLEEFIKGSVSQTGALTPEMINWQVGHLYMVFGDSIYGINSVICRRVIYFSHRKEEEKAVNLYEMNLERNIIELKEIINKFTGY